MLSYYEEKRQPPVSMKNRIWISIGISAGLIVTISLLLYIWPKYKVWSAEQTGIAEFVQAEQNRKITVLEAEAKLEAAKSLAAAEVERARGVAEANKIIGDSLKGNESYLRWLWIENLDKGGNSVIYVPTEAGLPLLEAGKR